MLGSAPGTDRLNDWVDDLDDDMSVEDLANHIEDSDDFQDEYPAFMTDGEFAEAFMGNLLGDYATAEVSAVVVEAVEGLLGAGHSRGEVALVVVTAMLAIAAEGESHDLYAELGMAMSIYSGFEPLDAGGAAGDYDIRQLGVEKITFSDDTQDGKRVTLKNIMQAGMGFSVVGVHAAIDYTLAAVQTGSRFDAVEGGIFTIDMSATGGKKDNAKEGTITGNAVADVKITGDAMVVLKDFSDGPGTPDDAGLNSLLKTAEFFASQREKANIGEAHRLLRRKGGKPPEPQDCIDE